MFFIFNFKVDDYLALHPEIRKQAEAEIARNDWSH